VTACKMVGVKASDEVNWKVEAGSKVGRFEATIDADTAKKDVAVAADDKSKWIVVTSEVEPQADKAAADHRATDGTVDPKSAIMVKTEGTAGTDDHFGNKIVEWITVSKTTITRSTVQAWSRGESRAGELQYFKVRTRQFNTDWKPMTDEVFYRYLEREDLKKQVNDGGLINHGDRDCVLAPQGVPHYRRGFRKQVRKIAHELQLKANKAKGQPGKTERQKLSIGGGRRSRTQPWRTATPQRGKAAKPWRLARVLGNERHIARMMPKKRANAKWIREARWASKMAQWSSSTPKASKMAQRTNTTPKVVPKISKARTDQAGTMKATIPWMLRVLVTLFVWMVRIVWTQAMDSGVAGAQSLLNEVPKFSGRKDDFTQWLTAFTAIAGVAGFASALAMKPDDDLPESKEAYDNLDASKDTEKRNTQAIAALTQALPNTLLPILTKANGKAHALMKQLHDNFLPCESSVPALEPRQSPETVSVTGSSSSSDESIGDEVACNRKTVPKGKTKKRKADDPMPKEPSLARKKEIVRDYLNLPNLAGYRPWEVELKFKQITARTVEVQDLKSREKTLRTSTRKMEKRLSSMKEQLIKVRIKLSKTKATILDKAPSRKDMKAKLITMMYGIYRSETTASGGDGSGGTFQQLVHASNLCLLQKLFKEDIDIVDGVRTNACNRDVTAIDLGCGLNTFVVHATQDFCTRGIGIEIDRIRCQAAGYCGMQFLRRGSIHVRNPNFATIRADILDCKPLLGKQCGQTYFVYAWDRVFSPNLFLDVIEWLSLSDVEYIVTFKPASEPAYLDDVLRDLHAEVVQKVTGLKISGSRGNEKCLILKRDLAKVMESRRSINVNAIKVDIEKAAARFMTGDLMKTMRAHEELMEEMYAEGEVLKRQRSCNVKKKNAPQTCLAANWQECDSNCATCKAQFRTIPEKYLCRRQSSIHGYGLFTTVDLLEGLLVIRYTGKPVPCGNDARHNGFGIMVGNQLYDTKGQGIHSFANHSCDPNCTLQMVEFATEDDCEMIPCLVTNRDITTEKGPVELTIDYGAGGLSKGVTCNCQVPWCVDGTRPNVLVLGCVQLDVTEVAHAISTFEPDQENLPDDFVLLQAANQKAKFSLQHLRDTMRCAMTQSTCQVNVFSVDRTTLAERHATCPLSERHHKHDFALRMKKVFDGLKKYQYPLRYEQVILDYFWCPSGWTEKHWKRAFYSSFLPKLAMEDLLRMGGKVFLPKEAHTMGMVAMLKNELTKYYNISLYGGDDLHENYLWRGTQSIPEDVMKDTFGKERDQEEIYCTPPVTSLTPEAMKLFGSQVGYAEARFVVLKRVK